MPMPPLNNCTAALIVATYWPMNAALVVQTVFASGTILIFAMLFLRSYVGRRRIPYHRNLKVVGGLATFFYVLHSFMIVAPNIYLLIQRSIAFSDPCTYGIVSWFCLLQEAPAYASVVGFTLSHALIFAERCIAAYFLHSYQNRGVRVIALPLILGAVVFSLWIYYVFGEEDLWALRSHCTPSSPTNAKKFGTTYLWLLTIDIASAAGDVILLFINKRATRRKVHEYTLQKSYQLRENDVALKLILPISLIHSAVYIVYMGVNSILRTVFVDADAAFFGALLEWMHVVVCAYTSVPLIAFYVFTCRLETGARRDVTDATSETDAYFRQLNEQFDAALPAGTRDPRTIHIWRLISRRSRYTTSE